MVRRFAVVCGMAMLLVFLGSGVAGAAATFDKTSVPAATDVDLAVNAPMEQLVGHTERLVVTVPDGFVVLSCAAPTGYTCKQSAAANPRRTVITWDNPAPSAQELVNPTTRFPFRMRTIGVPGKYKFVVDQFYSNGESASWNGPEGSASPAPVLTVTSSDAPPVTATTTPAPEDFTTAPPAPSPSPSFDFGSGTPDLFVDSTPTPTPPIESTPTTVESTPTTEPDLAINVAGAGGGDGNSIRGAERVVLFSLVALTVGSASFATLRQRRNEL